MPGIFEKLLDDIEENDLLLGICHTTRDTKTNHTRILKGRFLSTSDCPIYKQKLLYMFYGRPAYKVPAEYYPMCLVFPLEKNDEKAIERTLAFDSGAFANGRMTRYLGKDSRLADFELRSGSINYITRFIKYFFKNNKDYYDGKVNDGLTENFEPLLNGYIQMIKAPDDNDLDGRRRSLELQFGLPFDLKNKKPELLIISSAHIDNEEEMSNLVDILGCKLAVYEQSRSGPFYRDIYALVRSHFENKNML